jgi:hypothetical protein
MTSGTTDGATATSWNSVTDQRQRARINRDVVRDASRTAGHQGPGHCSVAARRPLYKWLDLLQTSELHLTRADQMEDRWEGAYSEVNVAVRPSLYGEHWAMMARSMPAIYKYARTHTYLNCWYMGAGESYAMWKIYDAAGKGVAIRATVGRLKESLVGSRKPPIAGAKVQYVDYSTTFIPEGNSFFPYVHKRSSFSHESEYPTPCDVER